jgi:hypothetical protein
MINFMFPYKRPVVARGCVSDAGIAIAESAVFVLLIVKETFPAKSVLPATNNPYPVAESWEAPTVLPLTSQVAFDPLYGALTINETALSAAGAVPSLVTM